MTRHTFSPLSKGFHINVGCPVSFCGGLASGSGCCFLLVFFILGSVVGYALESAIRSRLAHDAVSRCSTPLPRSILRLRHIPTSHFLWRIQLSSSGALPWTRRPHSPIHVIPAYVAPCTWVCLHPPSSSSAVRSVHQMRPLVSEQIAASPHRKNGSLAFQVRTHPLQWFLPLPPHHCPPAAVPPPSETDNRAIDHSTAFPSIKLHQPMIIATYAFLLPGSISPL